MYKLVKQISPILAAFQKNPRNLTYFMLISAHSIKRTTKHDNIKYGELKSE